jgi:hypothetical protein
MKESGWFRRNPDAAARSGEGLFTLSFADLLHRGSPSGGFLSSLPTSWQPAWDKYRRRGVRAVRRRDRPGSHRAPPPLRRSPDICPSSQSIKSLTGPRSSRVHEVAVVFDFVEHSSPSGAASNSWVGYGAGPFRQRGRIGAPPACYAARHGGASTFLWEPLHPGARLSERVGALPLTTWPQTRIGE